MASVKQGPMIGPVERRSSYYARKAVRAGEGIYNRGKNFTKSIFSGPSHDAGMRMLKESIGLDPRTKAEVEGLVKKFGPGVAKYGIKARLWNFNFGFTAYSAIQGFREEGLWGAAKGVGESAIGNYVFGRAMSLAGTYVAGPAAIAAGAAVAGTIGGIGIYSAMNGVSFLQGARGFARPMLHDFYRKHAKLEMGSPIVDPFGTGATMRQRSVMAIQNSKINGRSALGQEAMLLNTHYSR